MPDERYKSEYSGTQIDAAIGDVANKIGKYVTIDGDGGAINSKNGEIWMYVGETSDSSYGHFENGYFYKTTEGAGGSKSFSRINIQPNGGAEWDNLKEMVLALDSEDGPERTSDYRIGQVFFFKQIGVPEIWFSDIETSYNYADYRSDDEFIDLLNEAGAPGLHVGWYRISKFETDAPTKKDFNNLALDVRNLADDVSVLSGSFADPGQILVAGTYKDVLWHGTQEAYDALDSHNPEVLYIITP